MLTLTLAPFARVKKHRRAGLASGRRPPDTLMLSEAEPVAKTGVGRMTVNRALRGLQAEGLVQRTQGVGTVAGAVHCVSSSLTLRDLHEVIEACSPRHRANVSLQRPDALGLALAAKLEVAHRSIVFHTPVVDFDHGVALQFGDSYVTSDCTLSHLEADVTQIPPALYLFGATALWRALYPIEAGRACTQEAQSWDVAPKSACLIVVCRTFTADAATTIARPMHPGELYQSEVQFSP